MLEDLLDQSIAALKEIHELEKFSNDIQKQEKTDKIYATAVSESHLIVQAVSNGMSQLDFSVLPETKSRVIEILKTSSDAGACGMVQESAAIYIQKEISAIKKSIAQEWIEHYHKMVDQKINLLQTVKGIAPEREKVDYAVNKIKMGETWNFKQDNLDKMKTGLQEASEIIDNLGLGDDGAQIIEFLKKVADGKASVHDLTPVIWNWLTDKNMTTNLAIRFK